MFREQSKDLISYLQRRAGDCLRGVVFYDGDGYELLYVDDRIDPERFERRIDDAVSHVRAESKEREEGSFPFGGLQATVRVFETAVIIHLPQSDAAGSLVALDPAAARQLITFVHEMIERTEA